MREQRIEQQLRLMTKARGGLCLKFISPGWNGAPDRVVLFYDGKIGFVEVKRPGVKPRPLQVIRFKTLRRLGFQVFVLDKTEDIGGILDAIQGS